MQNQLGSLFTLPLDRAHDISKTCFPPGCSVSRGLYKLLFQCASLQQRLEYRMVGIATLYAKKSQGLAVRPSRTLRHWMEGFMFT